MPDTAASGPASAGISRDDAAHLARLARLALDDAELDALAAQLDVILSAVAAIQEVTDAADVPPTSHAVPLENVLRPDGVRPSLPRDVVLAAAPQAEDGRFRVPRILDDDVVSGDA
ncbi:MAG: Asp-tRNA(Asn)/Glu-tRNA(Gln) amidotransferase subunit GatC [Actinomycetota bacterium]|nr:Asp-tRNA(Asn)/Glu-tRNA(Gln) amidotransferase subunit GatC [Actinomycetota bacterium]